MAGMEAYGRVETTGVHGATVAQNGRSGKRRVTVASGPWEPLSHRKGFPSPP